MLKSYNKLLSASFIALFLFTITSTANASVISDLSSGITSFVRFFNTKVIAGVKNNICDIYLSETQGGNWKIGDFRRNILKGTCADYKPAQIEKISVETASNGFFEPTQKVSKDFTPKVSTPGALIGDINVEGNSLNSISIIYWTNIERGNNGSLSGLTQNSVLANIAAKRVQDMFAQGYFAHISPSGDSASKEAKAYGYKYITIGENIALGNFGSSRDLVTEWMNSPGHRANILNKNYTEIGVYAAEGLYKGEKVWIAAQIFGRPVSDCIEPDSSLKSKVESDKISAADLSAQLKNLENNLQTTDKSNTKEYNKDVADYNSIAKSYNVLVTEIKNLIGDYNIKVDAFNTCLKTP